jgi:hypothetical protein
MVAVSINRWQRKHPRLSLLIDSPKARVTGGAMKSALTFFVVVCIACLPLTCTAQGSDYQTGKIVAVEKLPATASAATGTDAPLSTETDRYNLGIQMGNTIYTCRAKVAGDNDLDWVQGKKIQARVNGKAMYVKRANGKTTKLNIVASKKSD